MKAFDSIGSRIQTEICCFSSTLQNIEDAVVMLTRDQLACALTVFSLIEHATLLSLQWSPTNPCLFLSPGLHNSMITAAIIGSLFFGLLVVVAVSCSCRLYALRLAAQRQEAAGVLSDSPPHFADGAAADFWFREPPPPYAVAVGEHRCVSLF